MKSKVSITAVVIVLLLIVVVIVGRFTANKETRDSSTAETTEWEMPTGSTDFTLPVESVSEPAMEGNVYTIVGDTFEFDVNDDMLKDFESFVSSDYLQSKLSDFLFDIAPNWIADSYTYEGGVMKVDVAYQGSTLTMVIDTNTGAIYWAEGV